MALDASRLQPPVSRILTKRMVETAPSVCCASSENRRFSWVQATTTSAPVLMACWKAPASRRHRVEWSVSSSCSAVPRVFSWRGMVLLQSQIRVVIGRARGYYLCGRLCHGFGRGGISNFPRGQGRGLGLLPLFLVEQAEELRARQLAQHVLGDRV